MTIKNHPHHSNEYNDNLEPNQNGQPDLPLADELARKLAQLKSMGRELGAFINGFQFNVDRTHGEVKINLRKKTRPKVELVPLLRHLQVVHPLLSVLGWSGDQKPMVWSANNPQRHLLISGAPHSGKTGLLRTLLLTLVLATRPAKLQLAIIDGSCKSGNDYDHSELKKFSRLPHLLNRPPTNPEEVCEIVEFLSKESDHRLKHKIQTPQILVVIDNVENILPVAGPTFHQQLEHILDIGPQTGIGVILSTNRPEDGRLQDLIAGMKIDRIVGKVHSAGQAAFATGRDNSEAEHLDGNGEFLAVINDRGYHFHAAWVGDRQLNGYLHHAAQPNQPKLLAWDLFDDAADDDYQHDEVETHQQHAEVWEQDEPNEYEAYEAYDEDEELEEVEEIEILSPKPLAERPLKTVRQESIYTQLNNHWMTADAPSTQPAANHNDQNEFEPEPAGDDFDRLDDEQDWIEIDTDQADGVDDDSDEDHLFEDEAVAEEVKFEFEPKVEPIEEQEHQLGWKTLRPWAKADESEPLQEEDSAESAAEELNQLTRRSRLPKVKVSNRSSFKPIPKPSEAEKLATTSENNTDAEIDSENQVEPAEIDLSEIADETESKAEISVEKDDEPFDPWLTGLDEETPIVNNGLERPPRLAQKKTSKPVRRLARPSTISREERSQKEKGQI